MINHYLSKGDPTLEILTPSLFGKVEALNAALETVKKYNRVKVSCNLGELKL